MNILVAPDIYIRNVADKRISAQNTFSDVMDVLLRTEYSVINLECSISSGEKRTPILKWGPSLLADESIVCLIKEIGFDCVTLANNHINDYGGDGVMNTINVLKMSNLNYVGAGKNLDESNTTLYKSFDDGKLAIINCCEHEFSIATDKTPGANPLSLIRQYYAIQNAKKEADYILLIVHGGNEDYPLPSPRMKEVCHFFVDAGVDAIIQHHQHITSGYEVYHDKPIFYGLGNFYCEGKQNEEKRDGLLVNLVFDKNSVSYNLIPYWQCPVSISFSLMNESDKTVFLQKIEGYNMIIKDDDRLRKEWESFSRSNKDNYFSFLSPYNSVLCKVLMKRHLLPKFLQSQRLMHAQNYIDCESHRDVLSYLLEEERRKIK